MNTAVKIQKLSLGPGEKSPSIIPKRFDGTDALFNGVVKRSLQAVNKSPRNDGDEIALLGKGPVSRRGEVKLREMAPDSLLEGIDEGDGGVLPVQGEPDGVFNAPGDLGQKRRLAKPRAGVHRRTSPRRRGRPSSSAGVQFPRRRRRVPSVSRSVC